MNTVLIEKLKKFIVVQNKATVTIEETECFRSWLVDHISNDDIADWVIDRYLKGESTSVENEVLIPLIKKDVQIRELVKAKAVLIKIIKEEGILVDHEIIEDVYDTEIDRFLKGQMTKEEEDSFRKHLISNKNLREKAKAQAVLIKILNEEGEKKSSEIINSAKGKSTSQLRIISLWSTVSAIAAIFIGVIFVHKDLSNVQMYADNNIPWIVYTPSRGGSGIDCDSILLVISNEIKTQEEIKLAISELENISDICLMSNSIDYYSLMYCAYLKNKDLKKAQSILDEILENEEEDSKLYRWAKEQKAWLKYNINFITKLFYF